ncbi:MAG: acetate--CoA ligase family protein [Elusimicrobiaceae bacterium]|nr:acetate--CoA ligase family protein [Elusimicrobiaceae bacterium]
MMKAVSAIFDKAFGEGRRSLSEAEVYAVFNALRLGTPKQAVLPMSDTGDSFIAGLPGEKAVIKISSAKTLHKTESGGVRICAKTDAVAVMAEMKAKFPDAEGIMISEYVEHAVFALGQELMLGARMDSGFGPILTLGVGGTDAEGLTKMLKPGTSPAIASAYALNTPDETQAFVKSAWIWKYAAGEVRGGKRLADDKAIAEWITAFAALMRRFDGNHGDWIIDEVEVNPLAVSGGRLVALDGVLRFKPAGEAEPARNVPTEKGVWSLLKPGTVAVAGVSESKMNMARIILNNVFGAGFPKEHLYILKDYNGEIDGVKCYRSCADFPEQIDMLVVAVPGAAVPKLLEEAGASGKINGLVLISGGMGEKEGTERVKDEVLEMIAKARQINPDFALSGGNSLGIVSNPSKVNTLFIPKEKMTPPLGSTPGHAKTAFISQSGAFVITVTSKYPEFRPEYCVTVGNQMDVTVPDYARAAAQDPEIKAILLYMEGLKPGDGLRLAETVAGAVKDGKKVAVYKAGRTPTGQKAVMGHTASIAGSFTVAKYLLEQAGAFVADTLEEFEDYAQMCAGYAAHGRGTGRLFILSNAGFESAAMADNIKPGSYLKPVYPSDGLKAKLAELLRAGKIDGIVDVNNPMDVTPMGPDFVLSGIAEAVLASGEYDAMIISPVPLTVVMKSIPSEGFGSKDGLPAKLGELARRYKTPVAFCAAAGDLYGPYRQAMAKEGLAVFTSADRCLRAFSAFFTQK